MWEHYYGKHFTNHKRNVIVSNEKTTLRYEDDMNTVGKIGIIIL